MMYAYSEKFVLPLSHDEVVHGKGSLLGKMPGDQWQKLANLRAYLAYMWAHPGKKLLFMGAELGQSSEWAESRELDWWLLEHQEHRGIQSLVRDLNRVYREVPAMWALDNRPEGFSWIDADDSALQHPVLPAVRSGRQRDRLCGELLRAPPRAAPARAALRRRVARGAQHRRRRPTGARGSATSARSRPKETPHKGQPCSAPVAVPPLGAVWLSYSR